MPTKDLFEDEMPAPLQELPINEEFGARFEHNQRRMEMQKLQDKYGEEAGGNYDNEDDELEESSIYSSEDSDGEFVTPAVDAAILQIINKIKSRDESIYNAQGDYFADEETKASSFEPTSKVTKEKQQSQKSKSEKDKEGKKKSKDAPLNIREYQMQNLLNESKRNDDDDEEEIPPLTNVQEAKKLKDETIAAFHNAVDVDTDGGDHGDEGDFLEVREKTEDERELEDRQYREYLRNVVGEEGIERALELMEEEGTSSTGVSKKKKSGKESKRNNDEKFLMDYILNRGWMEKKSKAIPTYEEITEDNKEPAENEEEFIPTGANAIVPSQTKLDTRFDDEDDEFEERADDFEEKYNFRFLEPGADEVTTHSRQIESLRRQDDSRKRKRQELKERKAKEKSQKENELDRLKTLKQQEVLEKLNKLKSLLGNDEVDVDGLDLEGDFDPTQYDAQMSGAFDEHYYDAEDPGMEIDEEGKPIWKDDIPIDDITGGNDNDDEGDGPINTDADFLPGGEAYDPTVNRKSRSNKKHKKGKEREEVGEEDEADIDVDQMIEDIKRGRIGNDDNNANGNGNGNDNDLDQMEKEYYRMEHEDIIGDMPTRFKYTKVKPNNFELTPEEILMSTDAELNSYVGPRKLAPYRKDIGSLRVTGQHKKLKELRKKLKERQWGKEDEATNWKRGMNKEKFKKKLQNGADVGTDENQQQKKKRKGKNERKKAQPAASQEANAGTAVENH